MPYPNEILGPRCSCSPGKCSRTVVLAISQTPFCTSDRCFDGRRAAGGRVLTTVTPIGRHQLQASQLRLWLQDGRAEGRLPHLRQLQQR